jgi:hypothetical protein
LVVLLSHHRERESGSGSGSAVAWLRTPAPFALSAGEYLVASTVALRGAKPNSLTQLGSVVLPLSVVVNYYACSAPAHLACCLMQ